jgi:hypothetical protein
MSFAAQSLAIFLAISLLCATGSNASPVFADAISNQPRQAAFDLLSSAMKRSAEALALVEQTTLDAVRLHDQSFASFHSAAATQHSARELQQDVSCSASQSEFCKSGPRDNLRLRSCMMAMFKTSVGSPMSSPFAFPSVLCQLANTNASCVSDLIGYYKTCACVDFQPMYDLTCPASPTASACSRNTFVRRFLALNTQNSSLGFFSETLMNFAMPIGAMPDLSMCGNVDFYRQTVLINGLGACLYDIVNAFPVPTFLLSQTVPGYPALNLGQMMRDGMRCAVTQPSYRYQSYCSGNIAKCFSLRQTPDFSACRGASPSTCPAGCKDQLAAYGNASSSNAAKCCVRWFQQQAQAPQCSSAAAISVSSFMGPECMSFMKKMVANAPVQPGQPSLTPALLDMMFNTAVMPAACAAKSPAALAVDNCAVPTAGLEPACADSSAPFVLASLFAPRLTTTATITFSSSTLKAVSWRLYCNAVSRSFSLQRSPRSLQRNTPKRWKPSKRLWNRG